MSENIESAPDAKKTPLRYKNCRFELVDLIHRLDQLSIPPDPVHFGIEELHALLQAVNEPQLTLKWHLIELSAPVKVVGNLHGHYVDLLRILNGNIFPILLGTDNTKYVFLGNYIDYGAFSLETIVLLLALQQAAPDNFFLLRGTREVYEDLNTIWRGGLYADLLKRFDTYHQNHVTSLMYHFEEAFSWMPVAALISKRILCVHGGISPELNSLDDFRKIKMPFESPIYHQLVIDLLWAEPDMTAKGFEWKKETDGNKKEADKRSIYETLRAKYMPHVRGKLWTPKTRIFGEKEVEEVCKKLKIDKIICGGKIDKTGYTVYPGNRLVTVFSALYHDEPFQNEAAFVTVSEDCQLNFVQLGALSTKCVIYKQALTLCSSLEDMKREGEGREEERREWEKKKKEEAAEEREKKRRKEWEKEMKKKEEEKEEEEKKRKLAMEKRKKEMKKKEEEKEKQAEEKRKKKEEEMKKKQAKEKEKEKQKEPARKKEKTREKGEKKQKKTNR